MDDCKTIGRVDFFHSWILFNIIGYKKMIPVNGLIGDLLEVVENALFIVLLEVAKDEEKLLSATLKAAVLIPLLDS